MAPQLLGEPGCKQPCRPLYLLHAQDGNSRPAPAPSHLTLPRRHSMQFEPVSSSLVYLAEQLLTIRLRRLFRLKAQGRRAELFAEAATGNGAGASNSARLYMPARERAALELFASLSSLQGALALLDDVDMGLHPHRQLKLMAALQELALRNDLQIVATTRNPTLLDCVPISGRRLLERKDNKVSLRPLHHGFMASEDSSQPG